MTRADHKALVRKTHRYNLKVATHVDDLNSMHVAVDSGSDMLQHVPRDGVLSQELVEKMLAGGQSNTPTLTAARFFARSAGVPWSSYPKHRNLDSEASSNPDWY